MEGKWQRDSCSFLGLVGEGRSLAAFPELEFGIKGVIEFTFPKASRGGWTQAGMGFTQADMEFQPEPRLGPRPPDLLWVGKTWNQEALIAFLKKLHSKDRSLEQICS